MEQRDVLLELDYRAQWLALLERYGVGHPKVLNVVEAPGILVQTTVGEPPGRLSLEGAPGNVLMVNMSPVQALRQNRAARSFVSDMLQGDMTLMPSGVPSEWSWNSVCDRLDIIISTDVLGEETKLDVVDRFLFRDREIDAICRRLYRAMTLPDVAERLYVQSLVIEIAALLERRHSTSSQSAKTLQVGGLMRHQARRVLEYIEANLAHETTLNDLAAIADLSPHHFLRMFKRTMSMTPHQYVLERRVEGAKKMLRMKTNSLVEIGLTVGFCNQSHFTTAFHRMVGATPAEFQKMLP
jgi:AraC family transcriptional regulator